MLIRRRIDYVGLGEAIKRARISKGLTQQQLGDFLGKHRKWISDLENERIKAAIDEMIVIKIEKLFEVKLLEH